MKGKIELIVPSFLIFFITWNRDRFCLIFYWFLVLWLGYQTRGLEIDFWCKYDLAF
jgi:hypothetical protein